MSIGVKIKSRRMMCQLTQEELADRCELTKGYISQIENDLVSPSISTLTDILSALGTDLKEFFSEDDEEQIVFGNNDYIVKQTEENEITWLVPNSQKNEMEPIIMVINPHTSTTIDMPHEGQEFGYILEGNVELVVGNQKYICKKGETFYFSTDKNHYLNNNSDEYAKLIWVSSPPNF